MIDSFIVHQSASVREALMQIDKNAHGVAFVVNDASRLIGVVTDGDIRRALLNGNLFLGDRVSSIYNSNFVSLPANSEPEEIFSALNEKIQILPLIDEIDRPVDFATITRLTRIPVFEPSLQGNEARYVLDCLRTNWISSKGIYIPKFENAFAEYTGAKNAVAVSSGSAALQLALTALGIGPGDEVIVPNLTFAATASAVVHAGATPVLVDVNRSNWNLDLTLAEQAITSRTRAIMPVHLYGMPVDMTAINELAERHGLFIVEDAAEGIGSYHEGHHVGATSDAGCFSFFGNKTITTGEGGMVLFADPKIAARARILRDHGMAPDRRYWHSEAGFNFRLTNLQAAIGVAQMENINNITARKHEISELYRRLFENIAEIELPPLADNCVNSHWAFTIIIRENPESISRDDLMSNLSQVGIETRPIFYPLNEMPPFRAFVSGATFPASEEISRNGLSLPSSISLTDIEIRHISRNVCRNIVSRKFINSYLPNSLN